MDMAASYTGDMGDVKVEIPDYIVDGIIDKLLKRGEADNNDLMEIVINYLRGYLEKIMDSPERIISCIPEDKFQELFYKYIIKCNILGRLDSIENSLLEIQRSITHNARYFSDHRQFNSSMVDIDRNFNQLSADISCLKDEVSVIRYKID